MPIPVACQCGQKFRAKDELAGKAVKCPKCGQALRIPSPGQQPQAARQQNTSAQNTASPAQNRAARTAAAGPAPAASNSLDDLFDEVGIENSQSGMRCMQCGKPMPAGGILCVHCGFNHQTGERIQSVFGDRDEFEQEESFGHEALDHAAKRIRHEETESKKTNDLLPWWAYLIGLIILGCFVGGMVMLPQSLAIMISGGLLVGSLILVGIVGQIWILVVAFQESASQGLLTLLVPFYFFYYAFTRWDECGTPFYLWLVGQAGGFIAGIGIQFLPGLMEDEDEYGYLQQLHRPAQVAPFTPGEAA